MIVEIDYDTIYSIWKNFLWSNRESKIESHSAMIFNENRYDKNNFNYEPTYLAFIIDGTIAGVNSGHMCIDNTYRSRGLFVFPQFRQNGIGTLLLQETIIQGKNEQAKIVWSYPRETSWRAYEKAGFKLCSSWHDSELGKNAYCFFDCSSIKS